MVVGSLLSAAEPAPTPPSATLYWRNGETLPGSLTAADETSVTWSNSLVDTPAVIDRARLMMVDFAVPKTSKATSASWSLLLRSGDCVHGDAAHIAGGMVELDCPRHGHLVVPISEARSLRRIKGGGLVYAGPAGPIGWTGGTFTTAGGGLATRKWDDTLQLPMDLPEKVAVDVNMRSTQLLNFRLGFRAKSGGVPTIETWGKDLVLVAPVGSKIYGLFTPLLKLKGNEAGLALRIFWDQPAQRMVVHDMAGKELGHLEWTMDAPEASKAPKNKNSGDDLRPVPGLWVKNRGANWVIDELCVRPWDGVFPSGMPQVLPRMETTEGKWRALTEAETVDLDKTQSIVWADDPVTLKPKTPLPTVTFYDGTMVSGRLVAASADKLTIKTPWSKDPVSCSREQLLRIVFEVPEHPVEEPSLTLLDRLHSGTVNIHGTIVCDGGAEPRWKFVGGRNALSVVKPKVLQDLEMNWARLPDAEPLKSPPSLLILDDGGMIRAGFMGMDESGVAFQSPWSTCRAMTHEHMRGLRMGGRSVTGQGFRDDAWSAIKGDSTVVKLTKGDKPDKDVLHLEPGGVFAHPSMVHGDEIRFSFNPTDGNYGGLLVSLFASSDESGGDLKITLMRTNNQLYIVAGDSTNGVSSDQTLQLSGNAAPKVKITFKESKVQVIVNEVQMLNEKVTPKQRSAMGLRLAPGSMWGNTLRPVEVREFAVSEPVGSVPALSVSDVAKQEAVLIPRSRREQPPSHVLVAANGDVVRGRIEAATDRLVRFTAGMETHDVPAERLQAILWPMKPKPEAPKDKNGNASYVQAPPPQEPQATSNATHWIILEDQTSMAVKVEAFTPEKVVGRTDLLEQVELPPSRIIAMRWAARPPNAALKSYLDWQLTNAPEPVLPEAGEQPSALLGKVAPDFTLPLLSEGKFTLAKLKGHVVVMDFWATWCGPCVASMPGFIEVMKQFKDKEVTFITLNQGEPEAQVKKFLERRSWALPVAMDADTKVAGKYGVDGIPHTVLVGKDGKVEWVRTGFTEDGDKKLREAVEKALKSAATK